MAVCCLFGTICSRPGAAEEWISISGIYPHLAMYNERPTESGVGETGIGAVVPWADRLWALTYSAHRPGGSGDLLYEIDGDLCMTVRPESVGGTPANRMIHRESNQLIIGPYFIDRDRNVRVIPPEAMFGRLTATARHLEDPANKVYFFTMEEGLYEVDVCTLGVKTLYKDRNLKGVPDLIPGYHGKGGYTGQGRLVVSNNGEEGWRNAREGGAFGCLAEWDGGKWTVVERRQYTEVTGPGGIHGAADDGDPVWATGWDERSVILKLLDEGRWHTYRLPKASYTYDGAHGWHTEWPRIRSIGGDSMLMTMHGMFWRFPGNFCSTGAAGITPLSTYLKIIPDFCEWQGRVIFASDDTSTFSNALAGRPHSNLWFVEPERLDTFGPPVGFGGVWLDDPVNAGEPSDPYLFEGFEKRMVHIWHDGEEPADFTFESDVRGDGKWRACGSIRVPAGGYGFRIFPVDMSAAWIRVKSHQSLKATAYFHYASKDERGVANGAPLVFESLFRAGGKVAYSAGLIRPRGGDYKTMHFAAWKVDSEGQVRETGYYEIDGDMILTRTDDPVAHTWLKDNARIAGPDFEIDQASVIVVDRDGRRYRLPKGESAFDRATPLGWPRGIREVVTERKLFNCHGTFYELPRDNSGGLARIKPVCTHNRLIFDFCSWRGLLAISGNLFDAEGDGHFFASGDIETGLWFGAVDDLWGLGKPCGRGGPWFESVVAADQPSDPYLMIGYDEKRIEVTHDAGEEVIFTIEVDPTGKGDWQIYGTLTALPDATGCHAFPDGYSAHWVRLKVDRACRASAVFTYN